MMLSHHLKGAVKDLDDLIHISEQDIADIKEAKHESQFDRSRLKDEKLNSFENKKAMIDYEISKLMTAQPDKGMAELLDEHEHTQLQAMKNALNTLREVNKRYAKMVLGVSTFYNALLERVLPTEMDGYEVKASQEASFIQVRA